MLGFRARCLGYPTLRRGHGRSAGADAERAEGLRAAAGRGGREPRRSGAGGALRRGPGDPGYRRRMSDVPREGHEGSDGHQGPEYQAPRVERVLRPSELEREVLYAGPVANSPGPG